MEINKKALIVVNGDNEPSYLRKIYTEYDLIISADGAGNILYPLGIRPNIIIGDFDSIDKEVLAYYEQEKVEKITLNPEKDYSDTHVSLDLAIEKGYKVIDIVGGFGGRWDHSIANLNLLYYGYEKGIVLSLIEGKNKATVMGIGDYFFEYQKDEYFSFFALFEDTVISLENMKFPLKDKVVRRGESIGLSNEYEGNAWVRIKSGSALIVQSRKD